MTSCRSVLMGHHVQAMSCSSAANPPVRQLRCLPLPAAGLSGTDAQPPAGSAPAPRLLGTAGCGQHCTPCLWQPLQAHSLALPQSQHLAVTIAAAVARRHHVVAAAGLAVLPQAASSGVAPTPPGCRHSPAAAAAACLRVAAPWLQLPGHPRLPAAVGCAQPAMPVPLLHAAAADGPAGPAAAGVLQPAALGPAAPA